MWAGAVPFWGHPCAHPRSASRRAAGVRNRALGDPGGSELGWDTAAGTDLLFMCLPGGRQRGWQPILHCPGSPGTSAPLRLSMALAATSARPAEPHELTWAGTRWCSVPRGSWHGLCHPHLFPPSPAHSRMGRWKTKKQGAQSCAC